jgi:Asp/Glu/hydantoin racemase
VIALGYFVDPLLDELREVLPVPVLGMAQTSMQLACLVSRRFAVLGRNTAFVPKFHRELVERCGLAVRCAGVFAEDVPFEHVLAGISGSPAAIVAALEPAARRAREAGAEVLLLGCGVLNLIAAEQSIQTLGGLPLLDTTGALMKMAETMVELQRRAGVRTSRVGSYSSPSAAQWDRALSVYGVHVPPPARD